MLRTFSVRRCSLPRSSRRDARGYDPKYRPRQPEMRDFGYFLFLQLRHLLRVKPTFASVSVSLSRRCRGVGTSTSSALVWNVTVFIFTSVGGSSGQQIEVVTASLCNSVLLGFLSTRDARFRLADDGFLADGIFGNLSVL